MRGMRFGFSLTTLLVLIAVVAVVAAASMMIPVHEVVRGPRAYLAPKPVFETINITRRPNITELVVRVAIFAPAVIAAVLITARVSRRLR